MVSSQHQPDNSLESYSDYIHLKKQVEQKLSADPEMLNLIKELGRVIRYEFEQGVVESERFLTQLKTAKGTGTRKRRTALISDIHGNYDGLLAVLEDIAEKNCDRIICLGDLVEGGPQDEEVVHHLMKNSIACIRGNHDEYNDVELPKAVQQLLEELPLKLIDDDILFTHISPREINRKINHSVEAWNVFDESDYRMIFVGHTHVPFIFGEQSDSYGMATAHDFEYNQPFELSSELLRDRGTLVIVGGIRMEIVNDSGQTGFTANPFVAVKI